MGPSKRYTVEELKAKRVEIDALIQFIKNEQENGHEDVSMQDFELHSISSYQTLVHLINAKMWIGKMLEALGNPFPAEFADKSTN